MTATLMWIALSRAIETKFAVIKQHTSSLKIFEDEDDEADAGH